MFLVWMRAMDVLFAAFRGYRFVRMINRVVGFKKRYLFCWLVTSQYYN